MTGQPNLNVDLKLNKRRQTLSLDWMPPYLRIKHWNKSLVNVHARTGEDLPDVPERHGYGMLAIELQPWAERIGTRTLWRVVETDHKAARFGTIGQA